MRAKNGFTLVELLVVIAIIGTLVALLLPAVQAARESARFITCANHIRQLGVGCLNHLAAQKHFPTGGWHSMDLSPDAYPFQGMVKPDGGFSGRRQPGSWVYNILPYMEQKQLRDLGKGLSPDKQAEAIYQLAQTPLEWMYCPSRRAPDVYPFHPIYPGDFKPPTVYKCAKGDYAANIHFYFAERSGTRFAVADGIVYTWSEIRSIDITDGLSNTILVGEKYLNPDHYLDGLEYGDAYCVYGGFDTNTLRSAYFKPDGFFDPGPLSHDRAGLSYFWSFGSAHPHSANFVFCDGSVHSIKYEIDRTLFNYLGNRRDRHTVPADCYD
ncbi:MAG: DUF1559 domain-containing protein [Pirellulales bacterium]|nr:DUF1559 domain-containing protein [Pirellulales bacterium]